MSRVCPTITSRIRRLRSGSSPVQPIEQLTERPITRNAIPVVLIHTARISVSSSSVEVPQRRATIPPVTAAIRRDKRS